MITSDGAEIAVGSEVFRVRVYRDDAGNCVAEALPRTGPYRFASVPVERALGRNDGEAFAALLRAVQLRARRRESSPG